MIVGPMRRDARAAPVGARKTDRREEGARASCNPGLRCSDPPDDDLMCVRGQCAKIGRITSQNSAAGFGRGDDYGVHG